MTKTSSLISLQLFWKIYALQHIEKKSNNIAR
jgi:hypothetical protein